ncbi:MAG: MerC domain-containing protein [Gemmatimonadaceae bacterium]|nr:MerC domain-containing protein [Gemmatimonadaceae bacterium]
MHCAHFANHQESSGASWLDRIGIATSTLCALHCAVSALFMGVLSALGVAGFAAPIVEQVFLGLAVLLGVFSLGSALRRHRSYAPLLWFSAGMLVLLVVRPMAPSALIEAGIVMVGAAAVIRAHWRNSRLIATSA